MGQKVNPQGFRLGVSQDSISHWFAKNRQYSQFVIEDNFLREYISKKFPNAGIGAINIERQVDNIKIEISSSRPRQLLGSFNKNQHIYTGIQDLRDQLTMQLKNYRMASLSGLSKNRNGCDKNLQKEAHENPSLKTKETNTNRNHSHQFISPITTIDIHLSKLPQPDTSAACLSEFIVEQLEKRIPFRRAMKQAVLRAQKANVKGIKVQISGRLNGAEIARSEWILRGRVPLHTLRAKVQYNSRAARTIYGLLGVKVWVFTED